MSHHGLRGRGRFNRPSYTSQSRISHQNNYSPAYSTQTGYAGTPTKSLLDKEPEQQYSSESINDKGGIGTRRRMVQSATPQPVQQQQQQQQKQQQPQPQSQQPQQQVQAQQQQVQAQPQPPVRSQSPQVQNQSPEQPQEQQQPQAQQQQSQPSSQQTPKPMPDAQQQPQQQQQPVSPSSTQQQPLDEKNVQEPQQSAFPSNQSTKQEADNQLHTSSDDIEMEQETPGEVRKKYKPWMKKGALGIKISRKIKKRRQNARLRNILAPKNAMMVLHELHPELKMTISEQANAANQMGYTVEIEIDSKIYRGHGMSKICAKQAGSENALKAVLLEKLEQNNVKINSTEPVKTENNTWGEEDVEMSQSESGNDQPGNDANKDSQEGQMKPFTPMRQIQEDDVPWGSLASFALYKLFSEWQSQGFQLPASSGLPAVFQKAGVPLPYPKKLLPEDASKKHPVQLLNQIRPGCQYIESREGMPPNLTFTFSVVVDGQTFTGVGTNKKDAKKECAKHALEAMGVKYD
ncbi:uncharacterized protein isoform X2 [Rhodnius prolixus]|uniref:uncharacterized protein isoform X2 n=1 Tax=Rhodnius prolixus TaxID=13249 RepID=UPI003D1891AC